MHFQQVAKLRRVGTRQQLIEMLEKPFAAHVTAEQFILQRTTRPIRQGGGARIQYRLIEERHHLARGRAAWAAAWCAG